MPWKRTRITLNTWQDGDFKITERPDAADRERFALECVADPDAPAEGYPTLDLATRVAQLRNELAVLREENIDLRRQLAECKQADTFERNARATRPADETVLEHASYATEGRDIPAGARPEVEKIAAELVETMAAHDDWRDIPGADTDEQGDEVADVLTGAF